MRLRRKKLGRALAATAGITIAALTLAGCASGTAAKPGPTKTSAAEAVKSDGKLTLYSGRNEELIGPLIKQFTAKTGIKVDARYGKTGEMVALLQEEGDKTSAQVFLSQDAGALGKLTAAGLTSTLPADITDSVPAEFTSTDGSWVGVTGRARVIAYDSKQLTEDQVPDSINDITAPKWKGKVAFPPGNASFLAFITALRVLEGEKAADKWVADMVANKPILAEKNSAALEMVNTGSAQLALINDYYWSEAAAEVGADKMRAQIKYLPGDPGGIVNVTGAAILPGAQGDPDALEFVKYLVSEAGQTYFVKQKFEYPLRPGIAAPAGIPPLKSLANPKLDLSDLKSLPESEKLLAKHGLL